MSVADDVAQAPLAHIRGRAAPVTGKTAGIGDAIRRLLATDSPQPTRPASPARSGPPAAAWTCGCAGAGHVTARKEGDNAGYATTAA